jgi:hypothetical protein
MRYMNWKIGLPDQQICPVATYVLIFYIEDYDQK